MKIQGFIKGGSKFKLPMIFARPRTMTFADYQLLTEEQKQGDIIIKNYPVPEESDYVEVVADGQKTWGQLIVELTDDIVGTKITNKSKIELKYSDHTEIFSIVRAVSSNYLNFVCPYMHTSSGTMVNSMISTSPTLNSNLFKINDAGTITDKTSDTPTSGIKITLYYNKTQTLELGTLAENCMMPDGVTSVVEQINSVESDLTSIMAVGSTNTTGSAIAGGTFFYLNGTLVRAKTTIASNDTFTLNTNYELVTAGALNSIISLLGAKVDFNDGMGAAPYSLTFHPDNDSNYGLYISTIDGHAYQISGCTKRW